MFMGTKTITIMDDAYELLEKKKMGKESFSEEIRRLFGQKRKKSFREFAGAWKDMDEKDAKAIYKGIELARKSLNRSLAAKRVTA